VSDKHQILLEIKRESGFGIVDFIERMADKYNDNAKLFISKITKPNSIFTIDLSSTKKILEIIFLSLVLSSYSYDGNTKEIVKRIQDICEKKGFEYTDLLLIMSHDDALTDIIKKSRLT
jgi:hypothetical protein